MCCVVCALNAHQRFVNQHAALVDMKAQILHSTERLDLSSDVSGDGACRRTDRKTE